MARILLTEKRLVVPPAGTALCESNGGRGYIVEKEPTSLGLLRVKLPVTILDQMNENRRNYRRTIMDGAVRRAEASFKERSLLSSVNEHPEDPFVTPGQASHIVVRAWCENDGYLWNEWDVLGTRNGRDLQALIEANAAIGVSIRGLGSQDNEGYIQDDYEYLGTDCVGQPSAKIRTAPQRVEPAAPTFSESTTVRRAPPAVIGTSTMKTRDDAVKYVREQLTLMAAEPRIDAMRRLIGAENTLAESTLGARDLQESYQLLDEAKAKFDEAATTAAPAAVTDSAARIAQLEAELVTQARRFRARAVESTNTFKTAVDKLRREKAMAETAARSQHARAGRLASRYKNLSERAVAQARRRVTEQRRTVMVERDRRTMVRRLAHLRISERAAHDEAVANTIATRIAITEAARIERARRMTESGRATTPSATRATRMDPKGGRVVETVTAAQVRESKGQGRNARHVTNANRNGTTNNRGWY